MAERKRINAVPNTCQPQPTASGPIAEVEYCSACRLGRTSAIDLKNAGESALRAYEVPIADLVVEVENYRCQRGTIIERAVMRIARAPNAGAHGHSNDDRKH